MQAILHCDKNWGIGRKNDLMFKLPEDMKYFKAMTTNEVVVMGSNTLMSFPNSKPLKNRTNIVLWPNGDKEKAKKENFLLVESLDELFGALEAFNSEDVFIVGGAMMYRTMLPYCDTVYLTKVDADGNAEVFFPNLDEMANWEMITESEPLIDNGYPIRFTIYRNNDVKKYF